MENYTIAMTAWKPSYDMTTFGRRCAERVFGAGLRAVQGVARAVVRVKGMSPGSPVWISST